MIILLIILHINFRTRTTAIQTFLVISMMQGSGRLGVGARCLLFEAAIMAGACVVRSSVLCFAWLRSFFFFFPLTPPIDRRNGRLAHAHAPQKARETNFIS